jgi:hypothetical protein
MAHAIISRALSPKDENMRRVIVMALVCASTLGFTFVRSVSAQVSSSYYIALNNYFSFIPAFPITAPQNEQAGDVYSRPGTIYARKVDCFREVATDSSETYLPRSIVVGNSNIAAQLTAERSTIAKAATEVGAQISGAVTMSFGEDGKVRWNQIVERNLVALLENSSNNSCRDKILRSLRLSPDRMSSVPWIIQSVWYATVNLSYQTTSAVDANAKAEIDAKLSPLVAAGSVSTEQRSDSLVIVNTGKTAFPVAWRPAFISFEHYAYLNELMDQGWFRYILYKLDLRKSDQEILEILQRDYKLEPKKVPPPKDIVGDMSRGKTIPFEQENEKHLAYVKGVNALFGLAQAIYGNGDPR